MSKYSDFNDFTMKTMYWLFGMCCMVGYLLLSLSDIVPMTVEIFWAMLIYTYGGFFGLILLEMIKR